MREIDRNNDLHQVTQHLMVWDRQALLERIMGDESLLNAIIDEFLNSLPSHINALEQAVETDDSEQIRQQAHSLKGVAGNIGALALQQQTALLEESAKNNLVDQDLLENLQQASEQLQKALNQHRESSASSPQVFPISDEQLAEQLQHLADRLRRSEFVAPDEYVHLKQARTDAPLQQLLERLIEYVSHFKNDAALLTIMEIFEAAHLKPISIKQERL